MGESGTILRYDGQSWKEMRSGTQNNLWGVWGSDRRTVFAVGEKDTVLRRNGQTWNVIPLASVP